MKKKLKMKAYIAKQSWAGGVRLIATTTSVSKEYCKEKAKEQLLPRTYRIVRIRIQEV